MQNKNVTSYKLHQNINKYRNKNGKKHSEKTLK